MGEVHGHIPFHQTPKTKKEGERSRRGGWGIINLPNTNVGPKGGTSPYMFLVILTSQRKPNDSDRANKRSISVTQNKHGRP